MYIQSVVGLSRRMYIQMCGRHSKGRWGRYIQLYDGLDRKRCVQVRDGFDRKRRAQARDGHNRKRGAQVRDGHNRKRYIQARDGLGSWRWIDMYKCVVGLVAWHGE